MSETAQGAALVVGGSGGIGAALMVELSERQRYARLFSGQRGDGITALPVATPLGRLRIDVTDESSLAMAAATLKSELHAAGMELRSIYICSGLLHAEGIKPERRLADLDPDAYLKVMQVNALGPLLVAKHLAPLLPRRGPTRLAAISARVGSISDNGRGGWHSYRSSKAALNMGFETISVEMARTHPQCVVTLFHPGTVATALSEPFQANVPKDKLFTPRRAASQFCDVLDRRDIAQVPRFVDWAGAAIAY